jgi:SPP1 family predicted phage head-tail adaptor
MLRTPKAGVTASEMNRRIQIQKNTPITNSDGTQSPNWQTVYTCWAKVRYFPQTRTAGAARTPAFSEEFWSIGVTFKIRFQTQVAITPQNMRVLYPSHGINHVYPIIGIQNTDEANKDMWLLCQETQAQAVN